MQSLAHRHDRWTPPIVKTVASDGTGIAEVAASIADYEKFLLTSDAGLKRRAQSWEQRIMEMLRDRVMEVVMPEHLRPEVLAEYAQQVAKHERDPYSLVDEIVNPLKVKRH